MTFNPLFPPIAFAQETTATQIRRIARQSLRYGNLRTAGLVASPPTISWSAANTAPTGMQFFGITAPATTNVFRIFGGTAETPSAYGTMRAVAATTFKTGGNFAGGTRVVAPGRFEVLVDSIAPIFMVYGSSVPYRIIIDGQYVDMTGTTSPGTFAAYYVKLDFTNAGGRKRRVIVFETTDQFHFFGGVYVGLTEGAYRTDGADLLTAVVLGDSFTAATGATAGDGFARLMLDKMGVRNVIQSGFGGSGFLRDNGQYTFRQRIQPDLIALNPDFAVIAGGLNDASNGFTASATAAEMALTVQTVRATRPKVPLFIFGPWNGRTGPSAAVVATDAAMAQAAANLNDPYLFYVQTTGWITGTGSVTAPTGSGNSDVYSIGNGDPTHPNSPGHAHISDLGVIGILSGLALAS